MAGASRYTALLDANVLFAKLQCDALLSLAHAGLYAAKWSADIEREWLRARAAKFPGGEQSNQAKALSMREAIPDCMVAGYEVFSNAWSCPIRTTAMCSLQRSSAAPTPSSPTISATFPLKHSKSTASMCRPRTSSSSTN